MSVFFLLLLFGFFTGWSVASIPLTLGGAPFSWLKLAAACAAVTALVSLRLRATLLGHLNIPVIPETLDYQQIKRRDWRFFALISLLAATLYVYSEFDIKYAIISSIIFFISCTLKSNSFPESVHSKEPYLEFSFLILIFAIAVILFSYFMISRPDADDAFYINLAISIKSASSGMMLWDSIHGADTWPLLGSNYRVETLPTLVAAVSYYTGLATVDVAHAVLPAIWCIAYAATLTAVCHAFWGRRWVAPAALALLISLLMGGTYHGYGAHSLIRFFHGKGVLVTIVVPLLFTAGFLTATKRLPLKIGFPILFSLQVSAVGLSANAIYLAPLAMGLPIAATAICLRRIPLRLVAVAMSAAVPVALGIYLLAFDPPHPDRGFSPRPIDDLHFASIFVGYPAQIGGICGLLAAAAIAGALPQARWISAYVLACILLVFNPVVWPLYERYVTGGLNFRLYWAVPIPYFIAFGISLLYFFSERRRIANIILILTIISFYPSSVFGPAPGMGNIYFGPSLKKVEPESFGIAETANAIAPPGHNILAPEVIAEWIPVSEGHRPVVFSRRIYLYQMKNVENEAEIDARLQLADWINGRAEIETGRLVQLLSKLCVGLIVLPHRQASPNRLDDAIRNLNGILVKADETASFYELQPQCDQKSASDGGMRQK